MGKAKAIHTAKTRLAHLSPGHTLRKLATKRIIEKLADDLGMVYFGYVDQRDDEHRLVRGFTVSSSHGDHHYTVGTYKTYDISLVIRRDAMEYPDRRIKDHYWTIMTFDLKTTFELPHFHILHHRRKEHFIAKFTALSEMPRQSFVGHEPRFFDFYTIYGKLEQLQEHCQLITPMMTRSILETFEGMSIEVFENTVYLYLTSKHPTRPELERMLRSGVWFAQSIDQSANQCYVRL